MVWVSFSLQIYSTFEFWRFKFSVVWVLVWVSSFYAINGGGSRTVNRKAPVTFRLLRFSVFLRAGTTPIESFSKKRSENGGVNENLSCGFPSIPGIAPGVAPKIVVFLLLKSWDAIPRMGCLIPGIIFWTPRAAPRIPRNSPRALRMAFSLRERFAWNWGGPQASELWAFCCHMWALDELHNIQDFTKIISKMIWKQFQGWSGIFEETFPLYKEDNCFKDLAFSKNISPSQRECGINFVMEWADICCSVLILVSHSKNTQFRLFETRYGSYFSVRPKCSHRCVSLREPL